MMQRKLHGFTLTPQVLEAAPGLFRPSILAVSADGSVARVTVWEAEDADPCCESYALHLAERWLSCVERIEPDGKVH